MKWLKDIEDEQCALSVYECDCGFHVGLDATYLDQCDEILIKCPSCGRAINTEELNKEEQK